MTANSEEMFVLPAISATWGSLPSDPAEVSQNAVLHALRRDHEIIGWRNHFRVADHTDPIALGVAFMRSFRLPISELKRFNVSASVGDVHPQLAERRRGTSSCRLAASCRPSFLFP
jgi:hypothetical protein